MTILTLNNIQRPVYHAPSKPATPRGRALFTIDWFINGKPVLKNHDNPRLSLQNGVTCF